MNGKLQSFSLLHEAAREGHIDAVRLFISLGAHIEATSAFGTPLGVAAREGHIECVKALVDAKADVSSPELIVSAVEPSDATVLQYFVDDDMGGIRGKRFQVTSDRTPFLLHGAASSGKLRIVSLLLELKCDVNNEDNHKMTPFLEACGPHYAVRASNDHDVAECLEALLAAGADPEAKDSEGRTALHRTIVGERMSALRFLLARSIGGGVENCGDVGHSPLEFAVWRCYGEGVRALLQKLAQASVDAKNKVDSFLFLLPIATL